MKIEAKTIAIIVVIAVIAIGFYYYSERGVIGDLEQPLDISEGGTQTTGLTIYTRNSEGEISQVPSWFVGAYNEPFTIVSRYPTPWGPCDPGDPGAVCTGYTTENDIDCIWLDTYSDEYCVLKAIAQVMIQVSVENPPVSEIVFSNIRVTGTNYSGDTSQTIFYYTETPVTLSPGDPPQIWDSAWMDITSLAEVKSYQVSIIGYNEYLGADDAPINSNTVQLEFFADPTGTFDVTLVSPL